MPAILPQDRSSVDGAGNFSERDLLYKVLFDMRKDMNDLKQLVFDILSHQQEDAELLKANSHLFDEVRSVEKHAPVYRAPERRDGFVLAMNEEEDDYEEKVEDISHETEEESLSLEHKEKEMILKALKKHNNKRKYAARDLGISERTLYRKLKQYDIEDM